MNLGNNLYQARKKKGLSQEDAAEKLGVSRQTISKWETDETLPDIRQAKQLSVLYGLSLDELISFDVEMQEIQDVIDRISDEVTEKIDWTKAWSKKYPILASYQKEVDISYYEMCIRDSRYRAKATSAAHISGYSLWLSSARSNLDAWKLASNVLETFQSRQYYNISRYVFWNGQSLHCPVLRKNQNQASAGVRLWCGLLVPACSCLLYTSRCV